MAPIVLLIPILPKVMYKIIAINAISMLVTGPANAVSTVPNFLFLKLLGFIGVSFETPLFLYKNCVNFSFILFRSALLQITLTYKL